MVQNDFPPEIIEAITSYFMEELSDAFRRAHLASCSLVCQAWRSVAQPLLFSRVIVDTKRHRIRRLTNSLTTYPHLRNYLAAFWLEGHLDNPDQIPNIQAILSLLPPLRQLRLHTKDNMKLLPHADVLSILPGMLSSDRLTSLSLRDLSLPVDLLHCCTALLELDIRECTFTGIAGAYLSEDSTSVSPVAPTPPIKPTTPRSQLERLSLFATRVDEAEILRWLTRPGCNIDVSQLKILLVSERSDLPAGHTLLCDFLHAVSPALENVCLDAGAGCTDIPRTSFIPELPAMNNLRVVSFGLRENYIGENNPLPWIIDFLAHLPSPQNLKEIYFHGCLESELSRNDEERRRQGWPADWARLDVLLTSLRFSHISDITFYIYDHDLDIESLLASLRRSLPGLSASGRLIFSMPDYALIPDHERHWQTLRSGPWRYGVGL
ncbi:hypothetical protein BDN72DRAFT_958643 [Pluteus cervinus]|uniref:Uncharacterized protein n=1 Tax=Pluteus cervinus TaxID=181527 RepID=A0ACD3AYJ4_9AGAR|nr:hypothetical protein BDN72DRAFT_958643 [Pluteus cervinus]